MAFRLGQPVRAGSWASAAGQAALDAAGQRIEDQPLTLTQAAPIIEKLLVAKRETEMFASEFKKLRDAAKIEHASGLQQAAKQ